MAPAVDACQRELHTYCLAPSCTRGISGRLLTFIQEQSDSMKAFASNAIDVARLQQLVNEAGLVLAANPRHPGPVCGQCGQRRVALLRAGTCCSHALCQICWVKHFEQQIPAARKACQRSLHACCPVANCGQDISSDLWRHLQRLSPGLQRFVAEMKAEVSRLQRRVTSQGLVHAAWMHEAGPLCPVCGARCVALLSNSCCGHAACEDCWGLVAVRESERCRGSLVAELSGRCVVEATCGTTVSLEIVAHLELEWKQGQNAVADFQKDMRSELARLRGDPAQKLAWGANPRLAGPTCSICCEQYLALISVPECNHLACEDCWATWASTQLDLCRRAKRGELRCIGEGCTASVPEAIWRHATTRNTDVASLELEFERRRRLQANILYPPEVQVDCPRVGCLGLGYLGSDTVMCFVCEHQWATGNQAVPVENTDVEMLLGEAMKRCPACGEHIIKNGGCNHMTCRCRHEFFWTTLLPYRR